ncbi:MAG: hypothetical protein OHK0017_02480 [Patescibacteria group bacterium]
MRKINIQAEERERIVILLKKIIGQLQSISNLVENDKITDQTLVQLLAVKGGANNVCKEIISKGVLGNIQDYTVEELDQALSIIMKL